VYSEVESVSWSSEGNDALDESDSYSGGVSKPGETK
jgi:hypothetical protein